MPLYDYECPACGVVEEHQVAYDGPAPTCRCSTAMVRLISVPGLVRISGPSGAIWDFKKQVEGDSQYGPRWRDAGTTGLEGGAGRRIYSR